jgi:signal transduction histidine kinase
VTRVVENPFVSWKWRQWLLLLGASTAMGLLFVFQNYIGMASAEPAKPIDVGGLIIGLLSYWYVWGLLFPFIVWLSRRFPIGVGSWGRNLWWHIPALILIPILHIIIYTSFLHSVGGLDQSFSEGIWYLMRNGLFYRYLTYGFLLGIIFSSDFYRQYRQREIRASQLEARLVDSQLQMLKNQLQPHFLFNTLHAISSLMHRDVEAADEMITRLGDLLRVTLESNGTQEVTLRMELEILRHYIEIEKIRLGERLEVNITVQDDAYDAMVPNLILQPIVENAVNYGVARHAVRGRVDIAARAEDGFLYILVSDDGPGLPDKHVEGVGLRNTRTRLAQLYGSGQWFSIASRQGGGVHATLKIPLRNEPYEFPLPSPGPEAEDPDSHRG